MSQSVPSYNHFGRFRFGSCKQLINQEMVGAPTKPLCRGRVLVLEGKVCDLIVVAALSSGGLGDTRVSPNTVLDSTVTH